MIAMGSIVAAGALAVVSAPSGATVEGHVSTAKLRYPAQRGYAIGYAIRTADRAETVVIHQVPPPWPGRRVIGSPLDFRDPSLEGPGSLGISTGIADYAFGACLRGRSDGVPYELRLELGPNERTTVIQRMHLSAPPWPGARYVPRVSVAFGRDAPSSRLRVGRVKVTGRSGVHVRLHSRPRVPDDGYVRPGRSLAVRGSTEPRVPHARIRVTASGVADRSHDFRRLLLGVARTDARGRFHLTPWVPPFQGTYAVEAAYRHPRAGLVADRSCGLSFTVRRR